MTTTTEKQMALASDMMGQGSASLMHAEPRLSDFESKSLRLVNRRTSLRLERALWRAFDEIATREGQTIRKLCMVIDDRRPRDISLTAAVRLFIIAYFRDAAMASGLRGAAAQDTVGASGEASAETARGPMETALAELG